MASASMIVTWRMNLPRVIPLVINTLHPLWSCKMCQNGSVPLLYNFRTLLGVSLLLFSFCLKLRDVSGRGELTSMQWGGGYSNWCDMCLGVGLIAGLSAITAGFSLLCCTWLSTDFPDPCVSTCMATFFTLFSWSTAYKNEISSAETESKQAQMK